MTPRPHASQRGCGPGLDDRPTVRHPHALLKVPSRRRMPGQPTPWWRDSAPGRRRRMPGLWHRV